MSPVSGDLNSHPQRSGDLDLWRLRSLRMSMSGSPYSNRANFEVRTDLPVPKTRPIFGRGVKRPVYYDLWPFDLETGVECYPWVGQPSCQLWCFCDAFLCRIIGRHASKWRRDVVTFICDLRGHRVRWWCALSYSIRVPSLKFVYRPSRSDDMADFRSQR